MNSDSGSKEEVVVNSVVLTVYSWITLILAFVVITLSCGHGIFGHLARIVGGVSIYSVGKMRRGFKR